jgi:hypothetical protein
MKDSTVINALDLKEIYQKIDGHDMDKQVQKMLVEDNRRRAGLSKERVKNWDNTLVGVRRKKLAGRTQRLLEEEEKRKELDLVFKKESELRDQEVIDKTKKLQYFGSDLVKNFHSRIMLLEVLQERDMQVKRKKELGSLDGKLESYYSKIATEKLLNGLKEDAVKQETEKLKKVQIAQEQKIQFQEKVNLKKLEREQYLLEGKKIAEADQNYKTLQKELESKRKIDALALRNELIEMKKDVLVRKEELVKQEKEYDDKINSWKVRKDLQNQKKKELEDKLFTESLNRRLALGKEQALISSNADAKLYEQIATRIKERDSKASKELEENTAKKLKRQAEIRHFYVQHIKDKQEKSLAKKEADKKELQAYLQARDDHLNKMESLKKEKLEQGKILQSFHKSQIMENSKKNTKQVSLSESKENDNLKEYMISVSKEAWAQSNSRLLEWISNELSVKSRPPTLADKYRVDTKARLGFSSSFKSSDFSEKYKNRFA